ncbi:MAG: hypothetical protein RIT02_196 [Planctomycetota bacterium]|jgi:hypothetical protein
MSGICICFTRRSETPTKEAYRILNRYDYIAKLWINGKSCAQLLIALPQVLTKSGPRRTATTLKKWVPASGFSSLRRAMVLRFLGGRSSR